MSRKKKTPAFIIDLITRHMDHVEWLEEAMGVKLRVPVENQAQHIQERSVDNLLGKIDGMIACLEDALHAYGCYAGFRYVARSAHLEGTQFWEPVGLVDPRFKEYRRQYLVRG
jgi:hypothetical protein